MTDICLPPDRLEAMLTELSKTRALTDDESDLLELIVNRGNRSQGTKTRWTPLMDEELIKASQVKGGVAQFARETELTFQSCRSRLHRIKGCTVEQERKRA